MKTTKEIITELKNVELRASYVYQLRLEAADALESLQHDIEAYRGALGYSIAGSHDGKLSNGETPQCGMCNSDYRKHLETTEKIIKALRILAINGDSLFNRIKDDLERGLKTEARRNLDFVDDLLKMEIDVPESVIAEAATRAWRASFKMDYDHRESSGGYDLIRSEIQKYLLAPETLEEIRGAVRSVATSLAPLVIREAVTEELRKQVKRIVKEEKDSNTLLLLDDKS